MQLKAPTDASGDHYSCKREGKGNRCELCLPVHFTGYIFPGVVNSLATDQGDVDTDQGGAQTGGWMSGRVA